MSYIKLHYNSSSVVDSWTV